MKRRKPDLLVAQEDDALKEVEGVRYEICEGR